MDNVVEIYVKIIIAVVGFIAPMTTYFLNSTLDYFRQLRKKLNIFQEQIEQLQRAENEINVDEFINVKDFQNIKKEKISFWEAVQILGKQIQKQAEQRRQIEKIRKESRKALIQLHTCLHYIQTERIYTIFASLFISLFFVMMYYLPVSSELKFQKINNLFSVSVILHVLPIIILALYFIVRVYKAVNENHRVHKLPFLFERIVSIGDVICLSGFLYAILAFLFKIGWINIKVESLYYLIMLLISLIFFVFSLHKISKVFKATIYAKKIIIDDGAKNDTNQLVNTEINIS